MDTALWIIQITLGGTMILLGLMKTFMPVEWLKDFTWTTRSSEGLVRFVGIAELLIGTGLILPHLTDALPILTSLAALSLCMVMVLAIAEHVRHKETNEISKNVIILLLAAFVAIERFAFLP